VNEHVKAVDDLAEAMSGAAFQLCRISAICGDCFDDALLRVDKYGVERSILEVDIFVNSAELVAAAADRLFEATDFMVNWNNHFPLPAKMFWVQTHFLLLKVRFDPNVG